MYLPKHFEQQDAQAIAQLLTLHPLATLVWQSAQGLTAEHLPLMLDRGEGDGENGTLRGHVARANPVWREAAGAPMLEGFWPWQPWRLRHGEHLGRVLVVSPELLRASEAWLPDPLFDGHRHLRVQLFAAAHGLEGGHVAAPQATLAVPVEAGHAVPADVAERCRQVLDA